MSDHKWVPPAGDVEVLAWIIQHQSSIPGFTGQRLVQLENPDPCSGITTELVDRAHVIRLQAERDAFRSVLEGAGYQNIERIAKLAPDSAKGVGNLAATMTMAVQQERDTLQADLTKARELLVRCQPRLSHCSLLDDVREFLAHQSAPAAKCSSCEASTVEHCDEKGCGYLGAGNGAPAASTWPKHPPTAGDFAAFNDDNDFDKRDEDALAEKGELRTAQTQSLIDGCKAAGFLGGKV